MPNDASLSTEEKFSNPAKPRIFPVLLTSLTAILNTEKMGTMIKIAIKITLGRIQR